MVRRLAGGAAVVVTILFAVATPAAAHPLGNFTVNHYHGLSFTPKGLDDMAVVDSAEIPTAQAKDAVDTDRDGNPSDAERSAYAGAQCVQLVGALRISVDDTPVVPELTGSSFEYRDGQAGLPVSRLTCTIRAAADLGDGATVQFSDRFESNRVGWREITAVADGVHLKDSPVSSKSITNALTSYPNDLLTSPLDVSEATFVVRPGGGASTIADSIRTTSSAGPFSRAMNRLNGSFNDLVGRDRLTLNVGLLAVVLAMLLGASHAVLPGHGKTVMAAYIAGRQGSMRDALVVGATVTATHTTGVIVLGLALTASSSLAGESVLRWLGAISGVLVAGLGVGLMVSAIRHKKPAHRHAFGHHHHTHVGPTDEHAHAHVGAVEARVAATDADGHHHDHGHGAGHDGQDHHHDHGRPNDHEHEALDHREAGERPLTRRGLVAMGIAGGLVPSPSALVVLLAAIALGRTIFGVALVLFYGLGMAGTLTATGLILVKLRDRYSERATERWGLRFVTLWTKIIPYTTATIVVVVGILLTMRSLVGRV